MRTFFVALIVWLVVVTPTLAETDAPVVKVQSRTKHVRKTPAAPPKAPSLSLDNKPIVPRPVTRSLANSDDKSLHVGGIAVTPGGYLEMGTLSRAR